jgi:hypothetical protein
MKQAKLLIVIAIVSALMFVAMNFIGTRLMIERNEIACRALGQDMVVCAPDGFVNPLSAVMPIYHTESISEIPMLNTSLNLRMAVIDTLGNITSELLIAKRIEGVYFGPHDNAKTDGSVVAYVAQQEAKGRSLPTHLRLTFFKR